MSIHSWMSILVGNQCSTRCEHCIWSAKPVQQQSIWWTLGRRQMCFEVPERNSISWNLVWTRWKLSVGEHVIFQECDFNDKIWRIVSSAQNSTQHQCQWSKWQVWWCNQCHWCWQWWRRQTRQPCRPERLHASLTLWRQDLTPGEHGRCCFKINAQELQTEWSAAIRSYSLVPPLHSLASDFKQRGAEVAATHSMALAISAPSWRFHCVVPLIGLGVFHRNDGFVMLLLLSSPLDDIDSVIWWRGCF